MATAQAATLPPFGTAILLAGGQGRRLGFDKQRIQYGQEPVVNRILRQLRPLFPQILVVTGRPGLYRRIQEELTGIRLIADLYYGRGPLAGIQAGLKLAGSAYVYVTGCDMPHVSPPFIRLLMDRLEEGGSAAGALLGLDKGRLEPLNAFYAKDLEEALADSLEKGEGGLQAFVRRHPFIRLTEEEARRLDPDRLMSRNINSPADLEGGGFYPPASPGEDAPFEKVGVERVTGEGARPFEDKLIREIRCRVQAGDRASTVLYSIPDRLEDLAVGWLRTGGLAVSDRAIESIEYILGGEEDIGVQLGLGGPEPGPVGEGPGDDRPPLTFQALSGLMEQLEARASLFRETGGTHNMLLADPDSLSTRDHCEDISRHNCLFKLLGRACRERRDPGGEILVTSSRLTATLLDLVAGSGIRQVISQAALSSGALRIARAHGIRLIAFARDGRFNRYD